MSLSSIALIAGNGVYPETFVSAARKAGVKKLVAAGFIDETRPDLERQVDAMAWFRVGQLSKMIKFFHKEGIKHAVMVGQIAPKNLFDLRPDLRTLMMLAKLKKRNAESLFGAIGDELKKEEIELLPATTFLEDFMPGPGLVAGPDPKQRRWEDAQYGFEIAKASSKLDIGQTVVVKKGTVLAVEAFEGTNECIKRGGALGKGGCTMVKVSKPNQDMRFDVPVIGPDTISNAAAAGVDVIAVEADKTLILDQPEVFRRCAELKVSLLGMGEKKGE
ncbi:UDP-2,3-diacylglucosamine diphosphatase LpxI [Roseimicrobium sp. ORNL1]|uniref:LpxI family protein n=1 Tax=Roseimicrobium sp. ORNL1 TaxID=2711231 RepID=UPI0013E2037C|nr:UDP-2,3-diacylglucosamine diphosphatase LpxI [Roseimicrobium sp. ORNL1]QIF01108.1 LpxI family protein [Roseimicrobium sp. ORNL1]